MSQIYPDCWPELSRQLREAAGRQCEACWVRAGEGSDRLAVDHVDGNTWNLRRSNLVVLCSRCHCIKGNISRVRPFQHKEEVIRILQRRLDQARRQSSI